LNGTFIAIATTVYNGYAITPTGALYTWGTGGGNSTPYALKKEVYDGPDDWISITAAGSGSHVLGIRGSGGQRALWSWGYNMNGQLGNGTISANHTPRKVEYQGPDNWIMAAAGSTGAIEAITGNSFGIRGSDGSGTLWAWGANNSGQLGNGGTTDIRAPVPVIPQ